MEIYLLYKTFKEGQIMTKEMFFNTHILPYLDDVINWKALLFLEKRTVSALTNVGLIKEREPEDRDVDSFIVCGEYKIQFHRYIYYISKIQRGDDVVYEYSEEKAFKYRPEPSII